MRASNSGDRAAATDPITKCLHGTSLRALLALCSALVVTPALAQRWSINPSIEAQATLTNNANYDNGAQRESDLIFNILPGVSFLREGPRLRVAGSASLNLIGYAGGSQTSRVFPQANVLANLEAVERFFFIEGALLANQEFLNPFLSRSDEASTFNKYTYVQSRISPYFQGDIDTNWRYLVRSDNSYTYSTQTSASLPDAYFGRHVAEIVRVPSPLGGGIRVQREQTQFNGPGDGDQRLDVALATVNYAFTPQLRFGLRGGYESTNYTASDTSSAIYGADVAWAFSPVTRLTALWEHRFFGPSYQIDFSGRMRRLAAGLAASRSVATYPELLLQLPASGNVASLLNAILVARFPDPLERARQVQQLIDRQGLPASLPSGINIFSRSANIVTSASGSVALIGSRNTLAFRVYYVKTDLLPDAAIPPTFIIFNNNTQKGASVSLSHQLSPVMSLNATASRREVRGFDQAAGTKTEQNIFELQVSRQLSPRSGAFAGARYQRQNSTTAFDGSEAAILVGIYYRL